MTFWNYIGEFSCFAGCLALKSAACGASGLLNLAKFRGLSRLLLLF